jgi:molybdopterin synthase sulfur carrier subunit
MSRGTVRLWAAARAAAGGVAETPYDGETLADAIAQLQARFGADLDRVLGHCSFVVDEQPVGERAHSSVRLRDGGVVEVLPPFAGG